MDMKRSKGAVISGVVAVLFFLAAFALRQMTKPAGSGGIAWESREAIEDEGVPGKRVRSSRRKGRSSDAKPATRIDFEQEPVVGLVEDQGGDEKPELLRREKALRRRGSSRTYQTAGCC